MSDIEKNVDPEPNEPQAALDDGPSVAEQVKAAADDLAEKADDVNEAVNEALDDAAAQVEPVTNAMADKAANFAHDLLVNKDGKFALGLRVYGWWLTISGWVTAIAFVALVVMVALAYTASGKLMFSELINEKLTFVLTTANVLVSLAGVILMVRLGKALRKNVARRSAVHARWLMWTEIASCLLSYMTTGFSSSTVFELVQVAALTIFSTALDPSLIAERRGKRNAELDDVRDAARKGMLGRDQTGKGYIRIDFFNLFWMFFVCSILGLILEIIWHMTIVDFGVYQDRAGLLIGPFSPIYGFGAVLVTLALNRLYDKNPIFTFVIAGLVGGAFEWATAFFMKTSFGITAWDYSSYNYFGVPDPVAVFTGGMTAIPFLIIWGILGVVWVKVILPVMLQGINVIPWRLRYGVTTLFAVLMIADGLLTLGSLDCWFERTSGIQPSTPIEQFFADYCNDDFMKNRFQSMTIATSDSTRTDAVQKVSQQDAS